MSATTETITRPDLDVATRRPSAGAPDEPDERLTPHRVVSLIATLSLFGLALASWDSAVELPAVGLMAALTFGGGLVLAGAILVVRSERALERVDVAVLALGLAVLVARAVEALYHNPGYGTDEAAFEQAAATLLLHGHDPYGANLLSALSRFHVPIQYATYKLNGGVVSTYGYPAAPLLLVAAFVRITGGAQAVPIANVAVLMVSAVTMFKLLPRRYRALAVLVPIGLPLLFGYAISGVNAIICMAALLPVAWRWTAVGRGGVLDSANRWQGACLGLAVCTQPLAWFVAPFVLAGVFLVRSAELGRRGAARVALAYGAIAAAVFAVLNLPFILWNPGAWLAGVASPLTQHAIPYGQGLIDLTLFAHVGGGAIASYTYAAAAFYVALLALYVLRFRLLGRACFVLPLLPFFFSSRSLAEYFMTGAAVVAVSVATDEPAAVRGASELSRGWSARRRNAIAAACLLLPFAFTANALATPQPLTLKIEEASTTGELQTVWRLRVLVHNRSDEALVPHFATNEVGQATTFWNVLSGPARLAPHATATYSLAAPNVGSMSYITSPFLLQAFTATPQTVSSSALFTPQHFVTTLLPSYVNGVIPAGGTTHLTVQLESPLGAAVQRAGVRVGLAQLIYGQQALIPAEARIDGAPEGATPVYALTDAQGRATFALTDSSPQGHPVFFQSWVQPTGRYPFGFSEIVSVLWR
ncbi:MAG TPA: hypothetical protein VMA83_01490 [Solirubrobacteraceae bacterium]|nr:hypothetical protein [Solirubrobacteraceae bacterium]